jgi:hypothetical protein
LGAPSVATGTATKVDAGDDVADGVEEIESAMMDSVDDALVWRVVVIVVVATVFDNDGVEVVLGALLATTVRTVLVGMTASFCPKHTLYADATP